MPRRKGLLHTGIKGKVSSGQDSTQLLFSLVKESIRGFPLLARPSEKAAVECFKEARPHPKLEAKIGSVYTSCWLDGECKSDGILPLQFQRAATETRLCMAGEHLCEGPEEAESPEMPL